MSTIIILVGPQMGENIGAVARAMKNFNVSELRIVAPRDGWPNAQARSTAVGAVNIIDDAKVYTKLEKAIEDIEYLYATSSVRRNMNKDYVFSSHLVQDYPVNLKVGIMFGRENCGLTNKEIALSNKILTINTGKFSSLNISQAVIVVCYELFRNTPKRKDVYNEQKLVARIELQYFYEHLFSELEQKNFFRVAEKQETMKENIINLFSRVEQLSTSEVQTLRGIIRSLSKKD